MKRKTSEEIKNERQVPHTDELRGVEPGNYEVDLFSRRGEQAVGLIALVKRSRIKVEGGYGLHGSQSFFDLSNSDMEADSLRLLLRLIAEVDYSNRRPWAPQTLVSVVMERARGAPNGARRKRLTDALNDLLLRDLVRWADEDMKTGLPLLMVCPDVAWRGRSSTLTAALTLWEICAGKAKGELLPEVWRGVGNSLTLSGIGKKGEADLFAALDALNETVFGPGRYVNAAEMKGLMRDTETAPPGKEVDAGGDNVIRGLFDDLPEVDDGELPVSMGQELANMLTRWVTAEHQAVADVLAGTYAESLPDSIWLSLALTTEFSPQDLIELAGQCDELLPWLPLLTVAQEAAEAAYDLRQASA